ncbi:MAG: hypothetical protein EPN93_11830, partial [Spirochaetes bacterium]
MKTPRALTSIFRALGIILVLAAVALVTGIPGYGARDVQFRSFERDKSRLEMSVEKAGREGDRETWERMVEGGKEALQAEWERDAETKISRALLEEGNDPALRTALEEDRNEARAEWEDAAEGLISKAEGSWFARANGFTAPGFDRAALERAVRDAAQAAKALKGTAALAKFDEQVNPVLDDQVSEWERALLAREDTLRARGTELDAPARAAFETELLAIMKEIREGYRLDRFSLVYKARNGVIADMIIDDESLKFQSLNERADAAGERIVSQTREDLKKEEARILDRNATAPKGADAKELEDAAKRRDEEFTRMLERGMDAWKQAQEKLLTEMRAWKATSEEAFEEGERAWRDALNRIVRARDEWRERTVGEMDAAQKAWQARQDELTANRGQAEGDLGQYNNVQQTLWQESSQDYTEMMHDGMDAWQNAWDNAAWLNEKAEACDPKGYLNTLQQQGLREFIDPVSGDNIFGKKADELLSIMWASYHSDGDSWRNTVLPQCTITPRIVDTIYDEETGTVTEVYNVTLYAEYRWLKKRVTHSGYAGEHRHTHWDPKFIDETFVFTRYTNVITNETGNTNKTRFYYYSIGNTFWSNQRDTFKSTIASTEADVLGLFSSSTAAHPGYLTNSNGDYGLYYLENGALEKDPYLMTQAEQSFELKKQDMDFWTSRFSIAEDVLKYASPELYDDTNEYAPGGMREGAAVTELRVNERRTAMDDAKRAYDELNTRAQGMVTEMTNKQQAVNDAVALLDNQTLKDEIDAAYIAYRQEQDALKEILARTPAASNADIMAEMANYEISLRNYTSAQAKYQAIETQIRTARNALQETQATYTQYMDDAADAYETYRTAELNYERAYAVWEYARTPYLMDSTLNAGGTGFQELTGIPVPDALENYNYIKGLYDEHDTSFQEALTALNDQKGVEDLLGNTGYKTARDKVLLALENITDPDDAVQILATYHAECAALRENGGYDKTLVLRDEASVLSELLGQAKTKFMELMESGSKDAATTYESVYRAITDLLVNDGSGTDVGTLTVNELLKQSTQFQDDLWDQQSIELTLRENRWGETANYIFQRGDIDWNGRVNDTVNEWKKWRIEARNEIAKGEKEWEAAGRGFQTEMNAWQEESSQTAGKRAQARSEEELKKKIAEYTKTLKKSLPGAMDIEIDADKIARKYATNNIAGLGVLTDSAKQADTTMGFTALFDLGISTGKYKAAFDEQMKTYADRMETMQTVRMAEGAYQAFQGMLA